MILIYFWRGKTFDFSVMKETSPGRHQPIHAELVRVNLLVPSHVRKEWKAKALAADMTLTDLIVVAMTRLLADDDSVIQTN